MLFLEILSNSTGKSAAVYLVRFPMILSSFKSEFVLCGPRRHPFVDHALTTKFFVVNRMKNMIHYYLFKTQKKRNGNNRTSLCGVPTFVETARKESQSYLVTSSWGLVFLPILYFCSKIHSPLSRYARTLI